MHISFVIRERPFSLPAVTPFSCHHSWVLFRGTPLNPLLILTNRYLHRFTSQPTFQTRSKYGPTLQVSYVVLPFITSRPLRLPYAPHTFLAGFTQLESCLPQLESCGDAGISGLYLHYLSPHATGNTPGPRQVHSPFASLTASAFSQKLEDRRVSPLSGVYPSTRLSQLYLSGRLLRSCTIRFMLRPAVSASTPDWVKPAFLRAVSAPCRGKFSPCVTTRTRPQPTYP
jgi:hypothetical protein